MNENESIEFKENYTEKIYKEIIAFLNTNSGTIYIGYDDNRKLSNKEYKYAKNIWADTIEGYLREKDAKWYEKPNNVVGVLTDVNTGKEATNDSKLKTILYYIKGTEPGYKSKSKSVIREEKKTTSN